MVENCLAINPRSRPNLQNLMIVKKFAKFQNDSRITVGRVVHTRHILKGFCDAEKRLRSQSRKNEKRLSDENLLITCTSSDNGKEACKVS